MDCPKCGYKLDTAIDRRNVDADFVLVDFDCYECGAVYFARIEKDDLINCDN